MKILFYAGYMADEFDGNTNIGLGGTEIAIIKLAEEMVKFGHEIIVSGEVKNSGLIRGVEWINTESLHSKHFNKIDIIIGASYIHFLKEFEEYDATKIFWAHNTDYHPWWRGGELQNTEDLIKQVDHTICLTKWHAEQWSNKYNIPIDNISVMGNGIDLSTFIGDPIKTKGKFIWSSAADRGLKELLENWHAIKQVLPHASLDVYSPKYAQALPENFNISGLKDIRFMGSADQQTLHDAMLRAEYWCYITDYEETYCITALEMQYAKVLPIVTNVAALSETVNSGIKLDKSETNWKQAIEIIGELGIELKDKSTQSSFKWAKCQTWNQRSYDLKNILSNHANR